MNGIIAHIFKAHGRSCDGIGNFSSHLDEVTVVSSPDFNVDPIFEVNESRPAVMVIRRMIFREVYLTAYPLDEQGNPDYSRQFGGCYIHSSDSRISDISPYPIPLHDRKE